MCGIIGFNWKNAKLAKQMTDAIAHRGPNDQGVFTNKNISLGHRRLSIIDLSARGKQPMFSEKKDIVVVFNGEIWNFKELKEKLKAKGHKFSSESDTEVIVHGYEEWSTELFQKLDGMFALAIYDSRNNKIILARDKVGKKPLYFYYNEKENKLIFASEIKALLLAGIPREVNSQALSDFLSLRHPSRNATMFQDVFRLPPGSFLVLQEKKLEISPYWIFPEFTNKNKANTRILDKLMSKAVEKRLMSDVPIGVFLSGGLDSSTLVAYLSRFKQKIKTFSIGFGDPSDETKYARIVSKKFNTEHTEILSDKNILSLLPEVIYHMDEPLADPASAPTYLLSREVSKHVRVVIAGDGGDEVFGGYQAINAIGYLKWIMLIPRFVRKYTFAPIVRFASNYYQYPKKQMLKLASQILSARNSKEAYKLLEYLPFSPIEKSLLLSDKMRQGVKLTTFLDESVSKNQNLKNAANNYYFKDWVPNDLLLKADKMSMAHGLEIRTPFLDSNLITYSLGLPNKHKQDRKLFRKTISKLLPKIILNKKKQGFTLPISNWFTNKEFMQRVAPHLNNLKTRGFFNPNALQSILNNPSAFKNDHRLWVLLNFEIWCKIFLDKVDFKKIKV